MSEVILRLPQVKICVGLSRSTIYAGIAAGTFPAPIRLSSRAVGWLQRDVETWQQTRIAQSRGEATQVA